MLGVRTRNVTVYCIAVKLGQAVTIEFKENSSPGAASFAPCSSLKLDLSAKGHAVRRSTIAGCPADEIEVLQLAPNHMARRLRVGV